jgi:peptidoglycan/xylan/chitin deacetylase (PgdA/CDA1 family)
MIRLSQWQTHAAAGVTCEKSRDASCSDSAEPGVGCFASASMKSRKMRESTAALAILFSLGPFFLLHAVHVKSESGENNLPAHKEKMGKLGEVERGPRGKNEIALTFDAGAEAECFDDLIRALANAHANSTFFITGRFVHDHSDCAAEITRHGHEVANHTWSHLDLTQQSDEVVRDEIMRAERAIVHISGQSPRPRWRAPYGARDKRVLKIAAIVGYRSIYWTLDSLDGVEPEKSPQFLIDRITSRSDADLDGAIILFHVGVRSTADALPAIIANLQARGFRLVTISQLLAPAPKSE